MKELFDKLQKTKDNNLTLIDTCFLIDIFTHGKTKDFQNLIDKANIALCSFTVDELIHVTHKIPNIRNKIRHFFKQEPNITIYNVDVHPGSAQNEKDFVNNIDNELLKHIADPSDAVLIAAALLSKSNVLTKDKHHLFTADLKNYLSSKGINVFKEMKDVL